MAETLHSRPVQKQVNKWTQRNILIVSDRMGFGFWYIQLTIFQCFFKFLNTSKTRFGSHLWARLGPPQESLESNDLRYPVPPPTHAHAGDTVLWSSQRMETNSHFLKNFFPLTIVWEVSATSKTLRVWWQWMESQQGRPSSSWPIAPPPCRLLRGFYPKWESEDHFY